MLLDREASLLKDCVCQDDDVSKVIQYAKKRPHWEKWTKFREDVFSNQKMLFVTVADECHWGPKACAAHDMMVNDYSGENDSQPSLLDQENYLVLLVSATPYNVISTASRLPEAFLMTDGQADQVPKVLRQRLSPLPLPSCAVLLWAFAVEDVRGVIHCTVIDKFLSCNLLSSS